MSLGAAAILTIVLIVLVVVLYAVIKKQLGEAKGGPKGLALFN